MDDTCSNVSFSSSAYFSKDRREKDEVDTTVGSSYFDKSVIDSLLTPEKVRAINAQNVGGVTLRGGNNESPTSECDTSSRCTGVEEIFHAALRFHDDLHTSVLSGSEGLRDKSTVSFADASLLSTIDGRSVRRKKPEMEGLNFLFGGSPIAKEDDVSFAVNSSFFGSPISVKRSPSSSISPSLSSVVDAEGRGSPSSSDYINSSRVLNTTPLREGKHIAIQDQSSFASVLGLTPVKSELEPNDLQELTPKKNLFSETEEAEADPATIECTITEESIELVRYTPTKYDTCTGTLPQPRIFGSNLQNRLNSCTDNSTDWPIKDTKAARSSNQLNKHGSLFVKDENVRGIRLCRAAKLRALGLESLCSSSDSFVYHDDSVDRSDF